jgi:hypothetical protein
VAEAFLMLLIIITKDEKLVYHGVGRVRYQVAIPTAVGREIFLGRRDLVSPVLAK